MEQLKILITIKTYPIPSSKYDELVCTAGVTETGDFIRLYPVNFRELEYGKKYHNGLICLTNPTAPQQGTAFKMSLNCTD
jgi:hypothetical protein